MTASVTEKKSKKMKRSAEEVKATEIIAEVPVVEKKAKKSKKEKTDTETVEEIKKPVSEDVEMKPNKEEKKKKKSKKSSEDEETVVPETSKTEEVVVSEEKKEKKSKKSKKSSESAEVVESTKESEKEEVKESEKESEVEEPKVESTDDIESKDPAELTKEERDSMTIIVFGLPFEAEEATVKKDFEECGEVVDFRLPMRDGQPRGMCFVQYKTKAGVKAALEFNQTDYGGRTLGVRMCESDKGKGKDGSKGGKDSKGKGKGSKGKGGNYKPDGCTSVVCKLLAPETSENSLWELFEDSAPSKIKLVTDRDTGESKCMAFIDFNDDTTLEKAIAKNNSELDGKVIWVSYNAPREAKGEGKDGKDGGKKGGKGKGKKGGKKGSDPIRAANAGSIATFQGTAKTLDDSDSD